MSLRSRVAFAAAGVTAAAVLCFGLIIYLLAARGVRVRRDVALQQRGEQAVTQLAPTWSTLGLQPRVGAPVDLRRSSDTFIEALDANGLPLFSTGLIDGLAPAVPSSGRAQAMRLGHAFVQPAADPRAELRLYIQPVVDSADALEGFVVAGQPVRDLQSNVNGLRNLLIITAVLSLLAALAATWFAVGRSLRPLQQMAEEINEISDTGEFDHRLAASERDDEIGRLSGNFNALLSRVAASRRQQQESLEEAQGALAAQQRFVADASHELRTPLTTIRSNAGFLLGRTDATAEDRRAALQDIDAEGERMGRLMNDLLLLARADARIHASMGALDLVTLASDVCRQARLIYPEQTLVLEAPASAIVQGNADSLRRLIWILIDNAVHHSGVGASIRLAVQLRDGNAVVEVSDTGAGIPETALPHLFERFYRADGARAAGGSGLGLAIAASITSEHGGTITAANNAGGGARFVVTLPLSAVAELSSNSH